MAMDRYFAYGSNLLASRMQGRVPTARCAGRAWLPEHRLVFDKHGRDGSAKANLRREPGARVWGVIWEIAAADWERLDRFESGYARVVVELRGEGAGAPIRAQTYQSEQRIADERPLAPYLRLIVEGARAQGLPAAWVQALEGVPARAPGDPGGPRA